MIVLWRNQLWHLDMCYALFQNFQKTSPDYEVEIEELNISRYRKVVKVPIKDLADWSVYRNLQALGQN